MNQTALEKEQEEVSFQPITEKSNEITIHSGSIQLPEICEETNSTQIKQEDLALENQEKVSVIPENLDMKQLEDEDKYANQIVILREMGFLNTQLSSKLLEKFNGDIPSVVQEYLSSIDY